MLNLMPCVFPVLALRCSALPHANSRRALLAGGLAYTAGVVLSFLALGALLLGLRAAASSSAGAFSCSRRWWWRRWRRCSR